MFIGTCTRGEEAADAAATRAEERYHTFEREMRESETERTRSYMVTDWPSEPR
jgi:hypothetical protein